jgi:uracil-DNA glycosylase family protein
MKRKASTRSAAGFIPPKPTLSRLREAAGGCTGCDLYRRATQTVFGEGPSRASIVLVGEQPGDQEDLAGHPFVGPAGRLLDQALAEAGLDRKSVYITNSVKHFKWEPQGKRRKHKRPSVTEISACKPWLEAELAAIRPKIVVSLGATAARSLFGRLVQIGKERGKIHRNLWGLDTLVTIHPSAILRHPEPAEREREYRRFVKDLRLLRSAFQAD